MKRIYLVFAVLAILAGSCGRNEPETIRMEIGAGEWFDYYPGDSGIHPKLRALFNTALRRNDSVVVGLVTKCYVPECGPKGFILTWNNKKSQLIVFRLQRIYQRTSDTARDGELIQIGDKLETKMVKHAIDSQQSLLAYRELVVNDDFLGDAENGHNRTLQCWLRLPSTQANVSSTSIKYTLMIDADMKHGPRLAHFDSLFGEIMQLHEQVFPNGYQYVLPD